MTALFSLTLFLSAALLFLVEPMIAKMLLPSLGGAPAVWNTCLVFFQAALLGGYVYAHAVTRRLPVPRRIVVHALLLVAGALALPVGVRALGPPPTASNPILWLLATLAVSVGLPFFVLASTTTLVQDWFARASGAMDPYKLYSASNLGSFAGLLAYPLIVERAFDVEVQSRIWSVGYVVVAALILTCARTAVARAFRPAADRMAEAVRLKADPTSSSIREQAAWFVLALIPASLTLSVTTYISTDIAAIPLVWIVPLSLYLLSLVVAFVRPRVSRLTRLLLPVAIVPPLLWMLADWTGSPRLQIPTHLAVFFLASLACHQALANSRPGREELPDFYVWVAMGGVAGGLFNALIAPLLFTRPIEYPMGLLAACYAGTRRADPQRPTWTDATTALIAAALVPAFAALTARAGWPPRAVATLGVTLAPSLLLAALMWTRPLRYALILAATIAAASVAARGTGQTIHRSRNFYGTHRVMLDDTRQFHEIVNGSTIHGVQAIDPAKHREPLAYYSRIGPAGQAFTILGRARPPREVALLGLGAGALACYATPGQQWTFFEIDPDVVAIAKRPEYFTYLADAGAATRIVLGDARLSLAGLPNQSYDLLVLDVFSSDAIPVHLLTREAMQLYLRHLAPHGLMLFHISSLYLNLRPVVGRLVADAGLAGVAQQHEVGAAELAQGIFPSEWVVVARRTDDLGELARDPRWNPVAVEGPPWTDRWSNILAALDWKERRLTAIYHQSSIVGLPLGPYSPPVPLFS